MSEPPFFYGMFLTLHEFMVLRVQHHAMVLSLGEMKRSYGEMLPLLICQKSSEPSPLYYSNALFLHAYPCRSKHKEFKHNLHIFKDGIYS
jgi:hypothetical protein